MLRKKILIKGDYIFIRDKINNDLNNPLCSGCPYYVRLGNNYGRCKLEEQGEILIKNICEILTPKYYNGSVRYIVSKKKR